MGELRNFLQRMLFPRDVEKSAVDRVHASTIIGTAIAVDGVKEAYPVVPTTDTISAKQAAYIYAQSPIVHSSVKIVAGLLANVPFNVYMLDRNPSGKKRIKRTGYPYQLLEWVNPRMTRPELIHYTVSWLKLCGSAYWAIEETASEYKDISIYSIYPLNPSYVKVVADPETGVKGYIYDIGTDKQWYPANRVIPFNNFSSTNYWKGMSEVEALSYDLQVDKFNKRQQRNFLAGGTILDGVLSIEADIDENEIIKLKREFKEQHQGTRNAHRILVLTKGMKFDVPSPPAPSEVLALLADKNLENHTMVFGVPVNVLLGKGEGLQEAKALMWENTIQPLGNIIENTVKKHLCLPISSRLTVGFDYSNVSALRLRDLDRARVEVAHFNTGIRTADQIREERDWEAYGDEFGTTPFPQWQAMQKEKLQQMAADAGLAQAQARGSGGSGTGTSPSLTMPGSEGGRDQSTTGEAQLVDTSGQKGISDLFSI
jgi:HK97 family phage portal protein